MDCKHGIPIYQWCQECSGPPPTCEPDVPRHEHDRLMSEKDAKIERLRTALRRIDRDIGISILHHDDGLWKTAYYRLKEVARAALGGDNG